MIEGAGLAPDAAAAHAMARQALESGEASEYFRAVILADPGSQHAEDAANLVLDGFVVTEDWEALERNAAAFEGHDGLGSAAFQKEVSEIHRRAAFKVVEVGAAEQSSTDRAAAWIAYADRFPGTDLEVKALNNAAAALLDAGEKRAAKKVRKRLK